MTAETKYPSDAQMCRQCKGLCCQAHPGVWIDPEHFLKAFDLPVPTTPAALHNMLPRELVLRNIDEVAIPAMLPRELVLRNIDEVAIPAPRKLENGCIFLQADGCQLPENRRPGQCLALVPELETLIDGEIRCGLKPEGSTLAAITAWRNFWRRR